MQKYTTRGFFTRLAIDNSIVGFFVVLYQAWSSRAIKIPPNQLILLSIGFDLVITTILLMLIFRRFTVRYIFGWALVDRTFGTVPLAIIETKTALAILSWPIMDKLLMLFSVGWPIAFGLLLISYKVRMSIQNYSVKAAGQGVAGE